MRRVNTLNDLVEYLATTQGNRRRIVAIAGAPGSGKSTFSEALQSAISERVDCEILPMDGFHFDDYVLNARGDRPRKGAPHTFDVGGFSATLDRLALDDGSEVAVPVFDRAIEIARAGARIIGPAKRLILTEGNYLLLKQPEWAKLANRFDLTIFLQVPEAVLERRLRARWNGYGLSADEIGHKLEGNDLPNARLVVRSSRPADIVIDNNQ
jgi:pantothenate kinase